MVGDFDEPRVRDRRELCEQDERIGHLEQVNASLHFEKERLISVIHHLEAQIEELQSLLDEITQGDQR
jgi:predicted RNase H-like nuclease (RuvC/YqgF family)